MLDRCSTRPAGPSHGPPWPSNTGRSRVVVSLSTRFQNQAALLRRIVAALGALDLDAVATTGPAMEGQNFDAPTNIVIVHSAPHDIVMKQASLVVTLGGHGTVARALSHGVPLLVIPMRRDQGDNAARVFAHGAGLTLTTDAVMEAIASATMQLIAEPYFREAAARLGEVIVSDAKSSVLETEREAVASHRLQRSARHRLVVSRIRSYYGHQSMPPHAVVLHGSVRSGEEVSRKPRYPAGLDIVPCRSW
jgi:UDP:flavonoid glycosyltransferase YjiC (YdhE family)